jgi:hypothetical protein
MQDDEKLKSLLNCPYCGELYSKTNKPLVMKCSHNICQECLNLNIDKVLCLSCNTIYEGKENKKHPINFLLLEIIDKSGNKTTNKSGKDKNMYKCTTCQLKLPNQHYHAANFTGHTLVVEEKPLSNKKDSLIRKSEHLLKEYESFNHNVTMSNKKFLDQLFDTLSLCRDDIKLKIEKNSDLDNLVLAGIINIADKEKLLEFADMNRNEKVNEVINKANSFEEIIKALPAEIKIENYLSTYCRVKDIQTQKLNETNITEKLNLLESYTNNKDIMQLTQAFTRDVLIQAYNATGLEKADDILYKCPYYLTENLKCFLFDVSSEDLKEFYITDYIPELLNSKLLSSTIDQENNLFIMTKEKALYMLNAKNKLVTRIDCKDPVCSFMTLDNIDNLTLYAMKSKLYVLYNNDKTCTLDEYNYTKQKWKGLNNGPLKFKQVPKFTRYDDYLYIFDTIRNFAYYQDEEWGLCKPTYRDSYNLDLEDFILIPVSKGVLIVGGKYNNVSNDNVFLLKDSECIISIKGTFKQINHESKLSYGFYIDNHYILEYNKGIIKVHKCTNMKDFKWEQLII